MSSTASAIPSRPAPAVSWGSLQPLTAGLAPGSLSAIEALRKSGGLTVSYTLREREVSASEPRRELSVYAPQSESSPLLSAQDSWLLSWNALYALAPGLHRAH